MRDTDAAHVLRAKTGTLSIASALSGVVPARGGEALAFSIIVNDYLAPVRDVWEVQDAFGLLLARSTFEAGPRATDVLTTAPAQERRP